jgi:hypothetical protein
VPSIATPPMLKTFKDIPNPYDFDVRPYRTRTCSKGGDPLRAALCRSATKS